MGRGALIAGLQLSKSSFATRATSRLRGTGNAVSLLLTGGIRSVEGLAATATSLRRDLLAK
jgi:hypothetical protein